MPTIDRVEGFAVRIYTNDHGPPHVHVIRGGASASIDIGDPAHVRVVHGLNFRDVERAVSIVEARWKRYLSDWRRIHGGTATDR